MITNYRGCEYPIANRRIADYKSRGPIANRRIADYVGKPGAAMLYGTLPVESYHRQL